MKQMLDSERVPVLRKRIKVHVHYIRTLEERRAKDRERIEALEAENARLMAMVNGINKGRFTEEEIRAALPATVSDCLGDRGLREHLARHLKETDE